MGRKRAGNGGRVRKNREVREKLMDKEKNMSKKISGQLRDT